jgi:hypothetical protein
MRFAFGELRVDFNIKQSTPSAFPADARLIASRYYKL